MFKSAIFYSIDLPHGAGTASDIAETLERQSFTACGPTQEKSCGWISPRHEYGELAESINGQLIAQFCIQTKSVPKAALDDRVDTIAANIEATTGRKPGKKERRALADGARLALLPHAFPKTKEAYVWVDRAKGLLFIDTSSQAVADEVVTSLVNLFESAVIKPVDTKTGAGPIMARWLHEGGNLDDSDRFGFSLGRACVLKSLNEEEAQVSYKRHSLYADEIRQHIERAMAPKRLDLTFNGRLDLTLHDGLKLTGIKLLDVAIDPAEPADAFDADVTIITAELGKAVSALIEGPLDGVAEAEAAP